MGTLKPVQRRGEHDNGHLTCPFCASYEVTRLFVASVGLDACECSTCNARWDEDRASGQYCGRSDRSSVLLPGSD